MLTVCVGVAIVSAALGALVFWWHQPVKYVPLHPYVQVEYPKRGPPYHAKHHHFKPVRPNVYRCQCGAWYGKRRTGWELIEGPLPLGSCK